MERVPTIKQGNESEERNLREQLDLRLRFVDAIAERINEPIGKLLLKKTDLHSRIFNAFSDEMLNPDWEPMVEEIEHSSSREEQLSILARAVLNHTDLFRDYKKDTFWPFRYGYDEKDKSIELHFGSMRLDVSDPDSEGLLGAELQEMQKSKLREMFSRIKSRHNESGIMVRGASWLYGREAYRRLYPPSYTEHMTVRRSDEFVGGGTWGQFQTATGEVNQENKKKFLENIQHLDPKRLSEVFPCPTYMVSAPIEDFYTFYGIE